MAKCLVATEGVLPAVVSIEEPIIIPEILVELAHSRTKRRQVGVDGYYTRKKTANVGRGLSKPQLLKICSPGNHMTKA